MKNFIYLLLFLITTSCTSDEESRRQINSGFQGEWVGTFAGNDSGTIAFTVQKEGTIVGNLTSSVSNNTESFEGYVNFSGKFDINTKSKYYFSGFLDNVKPVNGQWKKYSDTGEKTGTFTLKKQ